MRPKPVIVIVGPTASGKTSLSIDFAKSVGGEIICADSRTIYRELDIGTAKPSDEERRLVKHWCLDIVNPDQRYSAVQFQVYAKRKIKEIQNRGNVPIVVGGTGLYINSLIYDYKFPEINPELNDKLSRLSLDQLVEYCDTNNIKLPNNHKNKLHVKNAILRNGLEYRKNDNINKDYVIIGLSTNKSLLRQRINKRVYQMFEDGVLQEASAVAEKYGWDAPGLSGNIYKLAREVLDGSINLYQAIEKASIMDWQLAKRQKTWFKRDTNIQWLSADDDPSYLNKFIKR